MRHAFPEWYPHNEDTIRKIVTEGTIALDANVLLHLYRLGEHQRKVVLDVLTKVDVQPRLWLPYQVGLEYQRGREKVAYDQSKVYKTLTDKVQDLLNSVQAKIEEEIRDKNVRREALEPLEAARKALADRLEGLGAKHVIDYEGKIRRGDDPVRTALDTIFCDSDQVGCKPDHELLKQRIAESKKRYADEIPPGYVDPKNNDRPEGDYLIWCELLDFAAGSGRGLLFVTNDAKKDWYRFDARGNNPIGPRAELIAEMGQRTEHPYHQVTLDNFLRLANTYFAAEVDEDTLANTSPPPVKRGLDEASEWLLQEDDEFAGPFTGNLTAAQISELGELIASASPEVDRVQEILNSPSTSQLLRAIRSQMAWDQHLKRRP